MRIAVAPCETCPFVTGRIDMARHLAACAREDRHFVCHKALTAAHGVPADGGWACGGYMRLVYARAVRPGQLVRIAERLGVVAFVLPATGAPVADVARDPASGAPTAYTAPDGARVEVAR